MNYIEATTLGHLVDRQAAATPEREALVFPDARLTYAQLAERSDAFARALLGLGVEAGDKVGILLANRVEFVLALFGAAKLGAVVVPVNARFKVSELSHVIGHSDARVLITAAAPDGTDYPELLTQVFPELPEQDARALRLAGAPALRQIVDLDAERPGLLAREQFEAGGQDLGARGVQVRIRDVAMLMYTSGTSARPKGCLLTHEALVRHGANVARARFDLTDQDTFWDPLPLFHIGGIVPMLGTFSVGAKFVHAGHFEPTTALRMLEEERATVIYPAFETIWLQVLDHDAFDRHDLSAIRIIQSICVPERLMQLEARMPYAAQVSSYGATECSSNLTLTRPDDGYDARMNTLGRPLEGMQVKIAHPETGERLEPNTVGELCFKGYALFEGYYKDPELTAAAFDAEGYFHSQDLAKLDDAGRLTYAGRLKDMLKVGGENVSALEVEGHLVGHPAVSIAQVVAAPDAKYGEVVAAFVQLKRNATATEDEIVAYCQGQIASYKVPRHVRFVDEWPMSGTKIQKFVLREAIAAELGAPVPG
ncbi:AMP-binding protein [Solirubrobacter soli]|uniref:AMP-binding protein n=1 Tax=Solirubrobacter soli TaxID=363832 RepID=UPI000483E880|nr:AMP-binding protein [Solirubrobacter soli]